MQRKVVRLADTRKKFIFFTVLVTVAAWYSAKTCISGRKRKEGHLTSGYWRIVTSHFSVGVSPRRKSAACFALASMDKNLLPKASRRNEEVAREMLDGLASEAMTWRLLRDEGEAHAGAVKRARNLLLKGVLFQGKRGRALRTCSR